MVVTVPVLLAMGYWLLRRRVTLDKVELRAVPATAPVADTERGRMA
jgi:hypothetical protein